MLCFECNESRLLAKERGVSARILCQENPMQVQTAKPLSVVRHLAK